MKSIESYSASSQPSAVVLFRHGESTFNAAMSAVRSSEEWRTFEMMYEAQCQELDPLVHYLENPQTHKKLRNTAMVIRQNIAALMPSNMRDDNVPLTDLGWQQAKTLGGNAHHLPHPDLIYCSSHKRTCQTLQGVLKTGPQELQSVTVRYTDKVAEQRMGYRGHYRDPRLFFADRPLEASRWWNMADKHAYDWPGGESINDVRRRAEDFLNYELLRCRKNVVWVITHHVTILSMLAEIERWDAEQFDAMNDPHKRPGNASVTLLRSGPAGNLFFDQSLYGIAPDALETIEGKMAYA